MKRPLLPLSYAGKSKPSDLPAVAKATAFAGGATLTYSTLKDQSIRVAGLGVAPNLQDYAICNLQLLGVSDYITILFIGARRVVSRGSITTSLGIDLF